MSRRSSSSSESIPDVIAFSSDSSSTERPNIDRSSTVEKSMTANVKNDQIEMPLRGYSKWAPSDGCTLVWRDVSVYANLDRSTNNCRLKRIINNSSGAIQPGTLMALMGSSGSGKSTLMSALSFRNPAGVTVQGDILLNGRKIGPFMNDISGFVYQDDLFIGSLTVMEHLSFMANLRLDRRISKLQKCKLIKDLLEKTGLTACSNYRIGSDDIGMKVLSGGEKKRLAFASELLINPAILFCDEPTTGLDSYSAQQLVGTLLSLAGTGTTIMCTIHQPSSQLFSMFHQVTLLADGRIAFIGTPNQALDFFAGNGYICPETYNPADFLIGTLAIAPGSENASQKSVNRICDQYAVSEFAGRINVLTNFEMHIMECEEFHDTNYNNYQLRRPYWPKTLFWLCYRNFLTIIRDPTIQTLRIIQKIVIALMAGLCFFGSAELTQRGIQSVQGAVFIMITENTFGPMYSVLAIFPQGFPLFLREKRSGLYNTVLYYLANVIALIPGLIFEPMIFVVIAYFLAGLRESLNAFLITMLASILVINVATSCGLLFSTAFDSVALAMAYIVPFDYILMMTSGAFINLSSVSKYWSWMQYLSWLMYANEAISIVQWESIQNITCFTDIQDDDLPCLRTGEEVLQHYSFVPSNLQRNLWCLVILYVSFNGLALFFLWKRARKMR
ncbi:protein scarlet [Bradysia coprophila]|uniref:protein scarlet n=1 Tax=Bradysia coprophila TaxID=38358 RepID=UPI00187DD450|nr:protein scarlet [Bradysia coprophila]